MNISESSANGVAIIGLAGRIDSATAPKLERYLLEHINSAASPRLVVDFTAVDYISSAGLRAVLISAKQVKAKGGKIALCAMQEPVYAIFTSTGFDKILAIHPDLSAASATLVG